MLVDWINKGSGSGTTRIERVWREAVSGIEVVGVETRFRDGDGWRAATDDSKIDASTDVKTKDFQLVIAVVRNISERQYLPGHCPGRERVLTLHFD